ncbi:MAG TPA: phosphatase PAP2 family protein [Acidimicrobiales bacterium]|nr:phosphatase PAP2 family protein [Acidimicrobiales bacterium]
MAREKHSIRTPAAPRAADRAVLPKAVLILAASGAAIFVVGLILGLAVVGRHGGGPIQHWDNRVQTWDLTHRAGLVGVSKVIAFVGDAPKLAVVAAVIAVVMLAVSRSIWALVPLVAYLGGEGEVFLIREVVHRHRPPTANYPAPHAIPGIHETSWSFPSGHSVACTAILFALAGLTTYTVRAWWPWVVALAVSLLVLESRLVLGVHWFSDVVFGFVLGVSWGVTVATVFRFLVWSDVQAWLRPGRVQPDAPPSVNT